MAKGRIIIDANSISGGMVPNLNSTTLLPQYGGDTQYSYSSGITTQRFISGIHLRGIIAPGEGFTALTDTTPRVNASPVAMTALSNEEAFAILTNARVVQFGLADDTVDAHNATAHGAHTSLVGEDILAYKNSTDEYLLYSYRDNTDWTIGRYTKTTPGYVDNWLDGGSGITTLNNNSGASALTANKSVPHKMWIGPSGFIYATNGQYLMSHNPTTTVADLAALNLGAGWVATSGCSFNNYSAIVAYKGTSGATNYTASAVRVYLWDGAAPDPNYIYEIQDNYSGAIFNDNGILKVFTSGRNGTVKVWAFTGSRFELLSEQAVLGGVPQHGSVTTYDGGLLWVGPATRINELRGSAVHSRKFENGNTLSCINNLYTNRVYLGYNNTIVKFNIGDYPEGVLASRVITIPPKSTITGARVIFHKFDSAAKCEVSIVKPQNAMAFGGTTDLLAMSITTTTYPSIATDLEAYKGKTIQNVNSFFVGVRFNQGLADTTKPIAIERIEIDYLTSDKP